MLEVREFWASDVIGYKFLERDIKDNAMGCTDIHAFTEHCLDNKTYVLLCNGEILTIMGVIQITLGNFYVWQTPAQGFDKKPKSMVRGSNMICEYFLSENHARRFYTICKKEDQYARWMIKGCKFEFECELEGFGNYGEDMVQYKRMVR